MARSVKKVPNIVIPFDPKSHSLGSCLMTHKKKSSMHEDLHYTITVKKWNLGVNLNVPKYRNGLIIDDSLLYGLYYNYKW